MKILLFSIHDSAAEMYTRPFAGQSRGEAIRNFADLVNDPEHPVGRHPDDYTLFFVGEFDQDTGMVSGGAPVSLGNAIEFRTKRLSVVDDREVANG